MTVEVLVSTMNQTDYALLDRMRISTDAIVVNQCGKESYKEFIWEGHKIKWIDSSSKGLSVSRNLCLREASADICLLADDDLEYVSDYGRIVQDAFETHTDADIIRFRVEGIEKKFKTYPETEHKIGLLKSFKSSSVELAFKRNRIEGIWFDELIGAGTKYCMGEENAFLVQCIRKKQATMIFIPVSISHLHIVESSWKNISPEQYLVSRGAAFEAMETPFVHLLIMQFAFRKGKRFKLSMIQQIRIMERGRKEYLKDKKCSL